VTAAPHALVCAGCGWTAPPVEAERYPFRCPNAGRDDGDHVVTRRLDPSAVRWRGNDDPNPFVRHREMLTAWHVAREHGEGGVADEAFVALVRRLDRAVREVDGRGFRVTPFGPSPALADRLGLDVRVKDETGNVSGSHKARHLMAILLYLQVVERGEAPPLAIASCGNAALAAAVLARAVGRRLEVFVPTDAEPAVLARLRALGAAVVPCPRVPGGTGDPCVRGFHGALAAGALPFCCQGSENGLAIEGGETLAWEILDALGREALDVVLQVGGGAMASAFVQAFRLAHAAGWTPRLPRFHTVQTRGAWPLRRAWDILQDRVRTLGEAEALERAARHRSEFMWPWEETPRSVAHGILDDETYDWLALAAGMLASGGTSVVIGEDTLREANALAREATGIGVCHTGSAGLAGLLQLRRDGVIGPGARVAVVFSGEQR